MTHRPPMTHPDPRPPRPLPERALYALALLALGLAVATAAARLDSAPAPAWRADAPFTCTADRAVPDSPDRTVPHGWALLHVAPDGGTFIHEGADIDAALAAEPPSAMRPRCPTGTFRRLHARDAGLLPITHAPVASDLPAPGVPVCLAPNSVALGHATHPTAVVDARGRHTRWDATLGAQDTPPWDTRLAYRLADLWWVALLAAGALIASAARPPSRPLVRPALLTAAASLTLAFTWAL